MNPEFAVRSHPLGAEFGWELVGPDGQVWARGEPEHKQQVCELLGFVAATIQLAGMAATWAGGLVST